MARYMVYSTQNRHKIKKMERTLFIVFLIIGIVVLVAGTVHCAKTFDYSDTVETVGVITRIDVTYDSDGDTNHVTYVTYTINGVTMEEKLSSYSSSYHVGKQIEIYYHKDNPEKIGTKSGDLITLLIPGFGLLFACVGAVPLVLRKQAKNRLETLRSWGTKIDAAFDGVQLNTSYSVNKVHPYKITCRYIDPNTRETRIFTSGNVWVDPSDYIHQKGITTFTVYLDPKNSKKYAIDLDFLPEEYR